MRWPVIGIVGGMGPAAGNYFAQKITELTPATCDQEHPVVIHISNTQIPDRTAYLVANGEDPVPEISRTIRQLDSLGVDIICLPCNTAHAPKLFKRYKLTTRTPIAHMIEEAVATVASQYPTAQTLAILGTDGTRAGAGYDDAAARNGMKVLYPEESAQRRVMKLIYAIKRRGIDRNDGTTLYNIATTIPADAYIIACTELSMLSESLRTFTNTPVIDSLECLALCALNARSRQAPVLPLRTTSLIQQKDMSRA